MTASFSIPLRCVLALIAQAIRLRRALIYEKICSVKKGTYLCPLTYLKDKIDFETSSLLNKVDSLCLELPMIQNLVLNHR